MRNCGDPDPKYLANVAQIRASSFYDRAIQAALANHPVCAALGEPIQVDLPKGSIHDLQEGSEISRAANRVYLKTLLDMMGLDMPLPEPTRYAHISVGMRGPLAKGELRLFATLAAAQWQFRSLVVLVDGKADFIELLAPLAN
jgi:hypothetical protein